MYYIAGSNCNVKLLFQFRACRYFCILENVKHLLSSEPNLRTMWNYILAVRCWHVFFYMALNVTVHFLGCQEFRKRDFTVMWTVVTGQMAGLHALVSEDTLALYYPLWSFKWSCQVKRDRVFILAIKTGRGASLFKALGDHPYYPGVIKSQ